jgi:lipopolysaccharide transport system ATP-binding protein
MAKLENIIAFAELERFIDEPLRTYSSGMRLRLAFSAAIHIEPDILLVDEVLAVGDTAFQRKCLERIAAIKRSGCTIFLVSHDEQMIMALCDDLLLLREGVAVAFGPASEVMPIYLGSLETAVSPAPFEDHTLPSGQILRKDETRHGTQECQIHNVKLSDATGRPVQNLLQGSSVRVDFTCQKRVAVAAVMASITIVNENGEPVFDTNTSLFEMDAFPQPNQKTGHLSLAIDRLDLAPGAYSVEVGLYSPDWKRMFDYHQHVYKFKVASAGYSSGKGVLEPPYRWVHGI